MTGHIDRLSSCIETSKARSNEDGSNKTASSTHHVHNSRASKVNVATVEKVLAAAREAQSRRGKEVGEPALAGPGPVDNNRVDPHGDEPGVAEVGVEVEALSNGSSRDGGGSGSEGPLVEKVGPASISSVVSGSSVNSDKASLGRGASEAVFVLGKAIKGVSNEGVGLGSLSIGDTEPKSGQQIRVMLSNGTELRLLAARPVLPKIEKL